MQGCSEITCLDATENGSCSPNHLIFPHCSVYDKVVNKLLPVTFCGYTSSNAQNTTGILLIDFYGWEYIVIL